MATPPGQVTIAHGKADIVPITVAEFTLRLVERQYMNQDQLLYEYLWYDARSEQ